MNQDYQIPTLRELRDQQVRFAPREKKIEQADRAERLLGEIEDNQTYTYPFVYQRLIDAKPEMHQNESFSGAALRNDLLRLIEDLTGTAGIEITDAGEKVWLTEELCTRFQVTAKTISRWRKTVLVGRKFLVDGKKRIGFLDSSVQAFEKQHPGLIERGASFSQLSNSEKDSILKLARRLAIAGETPTEVSRKLAENTGRSVETIRYTLKKFDEQNPDIALFPNRKTPMRDEDRRLIYQRFRVGESVETLAEQFQRTVSSVYRVIGQMRADRIFELPLDYIDSPEFVSVTTKQDALFTGSMPLSAAEASKKNRPRRRVVEETPVFVEEGDPEPEEQLPVLSPLDSDSNDVETGLPPYLGGLYHIPLLSQEQEVHLFRKMNYLKFKAAKLRQKLDPERPKAHTMSQIESLYDEAVATKNKIVTSNLRLVVSIAKRHMGTGINFFDLVSDGNLALIKAVEKFDYSRGNKFSTYATWAIIRCFARVIPDEKKHRLRYRFVEDELFEATEDMHPNVFSEEKMQTEREIQVDHLLGELDSREQQIIMRRYGLGQNKASQTLREVGSEMGVTKERVRQIEARALVKLRKVVEEEHLDIPGL